MTNEQMTTEPAKLDGWKRGEIDSAWFSKLWEASSNYTHSNLRDLPQYLTSYDAIIPLVQKQDIETIVKMGKVLKELPWKITTIIHTPLELSIALLKAKGLYRD